MSLPQLNETTETMSMILMMDRKGRHTKMHEHEVKLIELVDATIKASNVIAVVRLNQPATLQTPEVPYLQIQLSETRPLLIPYNSDEEREADYQKIVDAIRTW